MYPIQHCEPDLYLNTNNNTCNNYHYLFEKKQNYVMAYVIKKIINKKNN